MTTEYTPTERDNEKAEAIAAALTEAMSGHGRCWVTVEVAIVEEQRFWRANVAMSIEPLLPMETPAEALNSLGESLQRWIERAKEKLQGAKR